MKINHILLAMKLSCKETRNLMKEIDSSAK
jgi:hypothetical protein